MKSKDQKRREAIERAAREWDENEEIHINTGRRPGPMGRFDSRDEYLDLFRPGLEKVLIYRVMSRKDRRRMRNVSGREAKADQIEE